MLPDPRAWGRHLRAICSVCLTLLFAPVTLAGEQCRFPEFFSTVINEEMLERVLAHEPTCRKDVDWLFWVGQALNTLRRYPEAADRLESVLMREPDHWQARVEYLVALEGSGEIPSARALQAELIRHLRQSKSVKRRFKQSTTCGHSIATAHCAVNCASKRERVRQNVILPILAVRIYF